MVVGTGRWWACDDIAYLPTLYKMYAEMDSNLNLHVPPYLPSEVELREAMVNGVMVSLPSRHL